MVESGAFWALGVSRLVACSVALRGLGYLGVMFPAESPHALPSHLCLILHGLTSQKPNNRLKHLKDLKDLGHAAKLNVAWDARRFHRALRIIGRLL